MSPFDFLKCLKILNMDQIGEVEFTVIFRCLAPNNQIDVLQRAALTKAMDEIVT